MKPLFTFVLFILFSSTAIFPTFPRLLSGAGVIVVIVLFSRPLKEVFILYRLQIFQRTAAQSHTIIIMIISSF